MQLASFYFWNRPRIAVSHCSRSQIMLCNLLRIPTILIVDYEFSETPLLMRPKWEIVPDLQLSAFSRTKIDATLTELKEEKAMVAELLPK